MIKSRLEVREGKKWRKVDCEISDGIFVFWSVENEHSKHSRPKKKIEEGTELLASEDEQLEGKGVEEEKEEKDVVVGTLEGGGRGEEADEEGKKEPAVTLREIDLMSVVVINESPSNNSSQINAILTPFWQL